MKLRETLLKMYEVLGMRLSFRRSKRLLTQD